MDDLDITMPEGTDLDQVKSLKLSFTELSQLFVTSNNIRILRPVRVDLFLEIDEVFLSGIVL